MAVGETFGKRIGPLPLWGWLIAGGGALVVFVVMARHKSTAPTSAVKTAPAPSTADVTGYSNGQGSNLFAGDAATTSMLQQIEQQLAASNGSGAAANDPAAALYQAYIAYLGRAPTAQELSSRLSVLGTNPISAQINDIMVSGEAAAYYVQQHATGATGSTFAPSAPASVTPPSNATVTSAVRIPQPLQPLAVK